MVTDGRKSRRTQSILTDSVTHFSVSPCPRPTLIANTIDSRRSAVFCGTISTSKATRRGSDGRRGDELSPAAPGIVRSQRVTMSDDRLKSTSATRPRGRAPDQLGRACGISSRVVAPAADAAAEKNRTKGAVTSKIKHAIKHKTRLAQALQPSSAFCFSLQPMTA